MCQTQTLAAPRSRCHSTGRHMGFEPELGIVAEGEMTLDASKGREDLGAGSVYWVPGMIPHDLRNSSSRPAKVWDILLKRCW
jgi:mannose-6-phosphate isomerase-like protein (cupin superfamily)